METPSRIAALANTIQDHTTILEAHFKSCGFTPSFGIHNPPSIQLPDDVALSRNTVLEASDELQMLIQGPMGFLTSLHVSIYPTLQALYRFGFASSFPVEEETTFVEIANKVGLTESDTRRLLRIAMTHRIFKEPRKGVVAHTAISKAIAEKPLLRQFCGLVTEESWLGNSRVIDAIEKWPGSSEPDQTGISLATGTAKSYFQAIASDPVRAKRFDDVMSLLHAGGGLERALLMDSYNWGAVEHGLIVDVGGSTGEMCFDIARRYPKVRCINQDLPDVVARANVPEKLIGQVECMAHDFFTEQPVKGADIYVFRWIFHDWADKYCIKILRNLIPALKKGAKVVVGETCLPEPNTERDADDWARLFEEADSGFSFAGVTQNPRSRWALMEAVWTE
ncbi:MAG: hypothetical protein Q9227_008843 [Pyrenula ochraceoflavens]